MSKASHMNVSKDCIPRSILGNINVVFFNEGHILRLRHHMSHSFLYRIKKKKEKEKRNGNYVWLLSVFGIVSVHACHCSLDGSRVLGLLI